MEDGHVLTNSRLCLVQCRSYVNICGLCVSERTDKEKAGACLEKIHVCIVFVSLSTFHPRLVESVVEDTDYQYHQPVLYSYAKQNYSASFHVTCLLLIAEVFNMSY